MNSIDALYAGFVSTLPEALLPLARSLPHALGLAPTEEATWSDVFSHPVTLQAPQLFAAAFPGAGPEQVRSAILGHALSVIEAFGTDRIADGQIRVTRELTQLLVELRRGRDAILEELSPGLGDMARAADRETNEAILEENALLRRIGAATFDEYRRISLAKQAVGFPASVALARAAGATELEQELVRRTLAGVWLGLQFEDDATDWEDDWRRGGGAWAVSLARRRLESVSDQRADERPTEPDLVRRRVHRMRVLHSMLRGARHQYRTAWRYARLLGAVPLVRWAEQRMKHLDVVIPLESRHAGYVVRAMKLAPWAREILT
jgi:hypothetical protein